MQRREEGAGVRVCHLVPTQPQSRGATGRARLEDDDDAVRVTVRDLVHPSYFGRDVVTGGVFNLFEVWLCEPRTDHRVCVGSLGRTGLHWKLDVRAAVRVRQFSGVIITAEHDCCPAVSSGTVVMVGCCCDVPLGCEGRDHATC